MEKRILDQRSLEMRKTNNFINNNRQDINIKFGKSYQNLPQKLQQRRKDLENLNVYSKSSNLNLEEMKKKIRQEHNSIDNQIKNLPQAKTIDNSRNNSFENSPELKPIDLRGSQQINISSVRQKGYSLVSDSKSNLK